MKTPSFAQHQHFLLSFVYGPMYSALIPQRNQPFQPQSQGSSPKQQQQFLPQQEQRFGPQQQSKPNRFNPQQQQQQSVHRQQLFLQQPPPLPGKGNGLLIFGTSNVVNHLDKSKLASQLKIPVRCIPAMKLEVFQEKSILLNPSRDWLVLVHGLGNDARNIARKRKSDSEKTAEADDLANEFCDIIENRILGAAQHICVLVSMLLPRVDFQEKPGMANPNNVRKVINIQITKRLYENPRVTLINLDKVLKWGDNKEELNKLMKSDGYHLTRKGFGAMIKNWIEHIRKKMKEVTVLASNIQVQLEEQEQKMVEQNSNNLNQIRIQNQDINGMTTDLENTDISGQTSEEIITSSAEVPTYDQQFPSLGGDLGGSGPKTNQHNPF